MVVNYNPLSIDLSTTNDLSLWLDDFEESFTQEFSEPDFYIMEDIFEEEELLFNDYFTFEEPGVIFLPQEPTELPDLMFTDEGPIFFSEDEMVIEELISDIETMMPDMSEEMMDELIEEMIEEMPEPEESLEEESIEEEKEEVITEEKEETSLEEKNFLEEEETESQTVTSFVSIKKENDITVPEFSSLNLTISIDQLSFDELVSSQPILTDVPFYEPIILYPNQLSYVDSRDIYSNVVYVANDSLTKHNFDVQENQKQTFKLQYKLRSMTWMD